MTRAHILGALDFSKFQRYDAAWYPKESIILAELENQAWLRVYDLRYQKYLAGISVTNSTELSDFYLKESATMAHTIAKNIVPWFAWEKQLPENMHSLADAWKEEKEVVSKNPRAQEHRKKLRKILEDTQNRNRSQKTVAQGLREAIQTRDQKRKKIMGARRRGKLKRG